MIQGRTFSNLEQVSVRYIGPVRDLGYLEQVQIFSGKKFIYFVRIGWKKGEKRGGGGIGVLFHVFTLVSNYSARIT